MNTKVAETVVRYKMFEDGDTVLCALSGGADSTALLLALKELGAQVFAVHVNHNLRGEESLRDEVFCKELCTQLGVELIVESIKVAEVCKMRKIGIEEGARKLRYEALIRYAQERNAVICTAHNAGDSLETAVFNLARGTSLKGLCGISAVRFFGTTKIARPLINCTRTEIEDYLNSKNQAFVTDSTNLCDDYTRNKIRHGVIPRLEEINPSAVKAFCRTSVVLSDEEDFLSTLASNELETLKIGDKLDCKRLCKLHIAIQRRVISLFFDEKDAERSHDKIESVRLAVLSDKDSKINIEKSVYAVVNTGMLSIIRENPDDFSACECELEPEFDRPFDFLGRQAVLKKMAIDTKMVNVHKMFAKCGLDCDKIIGKAIVRNRRAGDRIAFVGRGFTTSIKKLFNSDIERANRQKILFVADEQGVIFVEGYGSAQRTAVDENTKNVVVVEVEKFPCLDA